MNPARLSNCFWLNSLMLSSALVPNGPPTGFICWLWNHRQNLLLHCFKIQIVAQLTTEGWQDWLVCVLPRRQLQDAENKDILATDNVDIYNDEEDNTVC